MIQNRNRNSDSRNGYDTWPVNSSNAEGGPMFLQSQALYHSIANQCSTRGPLIFDEPEAFKFHYMFYGLRTWAVTCDKNLAWTVCTMFGTKTSFLR